MVGTIERLTELGGGGTLALVVILLVLLLCGVGFPMAEEVPIIAAAYLSYLGVVSPELCFLLLLLAILGGDTMLFYIGYHFGHQIFKVPLFARMLTPKRVKRVNDYFHRYGNRVIFFGRFIAGVRATLFLTAGILKMRYRRFILFDGIAAAISVAVNIAVVRHFGQEIDDAILAIRKTGRTVLILSIVAMLVMIYVFIRRRRLAAELKASQGASNEHSRLPEQLGSGEGLR